MRGEGSIQVDHLLEAPLEDLVDLEVHEEDLIDHHLEMREVGSLLDAANH